MDKICLEESKVVDNVINEQLILQSIRSPFLLQMDHYFESESTIYFFTEFMPGKDLKYQVGKHGRGLTLNEVQMIGAQLVIGLE